MQSTEPMQVRLDMVTMHKFLDDKIHAAMDAGYYLEASWLIYSCMENRFFRVLDKFKRQCEYCTKTSKCRKGSNQLALSTKVACVDRLRGAGVSCIANAFDQELLKSVKGWAKQRNTLMHNLLSLEHYEEHFNQDFELLATEGIPILAELYEACSVFRKLFFKEDYVFQFPKECMDACACNSKNRASAPAATEGVRNQP